MFFHVKERRELLGKTSEEIRPTDSRAATIGGGVRLSALAGPGIPGVVRAAAPRRRRQTVMFIMVIEPQLRIARDAVLAQGLSEQIDLVGIRDGRVEDELVEAELTKGVDRAGDRLSRA